MNVTADQLYKIAVENKITMWVAENCPTCDYPIHYRFYKRDEVLLDAGCRCSDETVRERYMKSSWEDVAIYINNQSDYDKMKEIKQFWKL